jgi:hypothetical protein
MTIGSLKPPVAGSRAMPLPVEQAILLPSGDHAGCHPLNGLSCRRSAPLALTV